MISAQTLRYVSNMAADCKDYEIMLALVRGRAAARRTAAVPRWRVSFESGTWDSGPVEVQARSAFSAIEDALTTLADEGGNWPWTAIEGTIRFRRLG
jgi:hypothetical protein